MAEVRDKPQRVLALSQIVQCSRWFKNGDHPKDFCTTIQGSDGSSSLSEGKVVRMYRRPDVAGHKPCPECGCGYDAHGWIDSGGNGRQVCPGQWVVQIGQQFYPVDDDLFRQLFEII